MMGSMGSVDVDEFAAGGGRDGVPTGVERLEAIRLRLVTDIEAEPPADRARDAASRAAAALAAVSEVDPSQLDPAELRAWLEDVETLRRTVDAAAVAAAGVIDRSNPFREQGFLSAKTPVKHMCRLSGPEAHRRVQTARLHDALPEWADAEADGRVGVAQSELMARIAANPRIPAAVLERDSPALLHDAISQPFDEFERRARRWEALADPDGDLARHERLHANRDIRVRPRPEGGWTITGNLAELAGCEFNEIFSWFIEAEWHTDWADARHRLGDTATTNDLPRTEAQRRADAFVAMARAAASTPPGSRAPRPTAQRPDRPRNLRSTPTRRNPRPTPLPRRRRTHPHRTPSAPRRRHQRRTDRPHPPRRLRRLRHHHRPRPPPTPLPRILTRRRHAAVDHLHLDRLRPTDRLVRRRPLTRLESPRRHRAPQRRTTLPRPPPPQGAGLTRSTATTTAPGTSSTPTATRSTESAAPVLAWGPPVQSRTDRGTVTTRARSHSPSALACASWRVDAATPSCRSPRTTKFSERRFGNR